MLIVSPVEGVAPVSVVNVNLISFFDKPGIGVEVVKYKKLVFTAPASPSAVKLFNVTLVSLKTVALQETSE
jgi:hypothetical protein